GKEISRRGEAGRNGLSHAGERTEGGSRRLRKAAGEGVPQRVERRQVVVERSHHLGGEREAVQPVIGNNVGNVEDPVSAARHDAVGDAIGVADAGSEEGGRHVQVFARDVAGGQEPQPASGAEGRQLRYGSFRVV